MQTEKLAKEPNKTKYFYVYSLMYLYFGFIISLSGGLYQELKLQLHTSTHLIGYLFTIRSIAFIISAIISAYIIDNIKNSHKFISLSLILCSISICLIYYVINTWHMFIIFTFIGFGMGTCELCIPVLTFRLFPNKGPRMFLISTVIYGIAKLLSPVLIQLSIYFIGKYYIATYIISFNGILFSIIICFLDTPKHDNLRVIKNEITKMKKKEKKGRMRQIPNNNVNIDSIASTNITRISLSETTKQNINQMSNEAKNQLNLDKKHKSMKYFIVFILISLYCIYSIVRNGFTSFIVPYVNGMLFNLFYM